MSDQSYSILDEASKQRGMIDEEEEARKRALMAGALGHSQSRPLDDSSGQALAPMGRTEPTAAISPKAAQSITEPAEPTTQPVSITGERAPKPASGRVYGDDEDQARERKGLLSQAGAQAPWGPTTELPASITETGQKPAASVASATPATAQPAAKPTESITGPPPTAATPAASITAPPLEQMGPAGQREKDLLANAPHHFDKNLGKDVPGYGGWRKGLDILGRVTAPGAAIEQMTGLGTLGYQANLRRADEAAKLEQEQQMRPLDVAARRNVAEATQGAAQFNTPQKRQAYMAQNPNLFTGASEFEKNDFVLTGKFPQREPAAPKEADKKIDEYANEQGQRVLTFQRADGSIYDRVGGKTQPKPAGHTSPFEAFAYGMPEEKKAAQDFLTFEKHMDRQNQKPSDAEFRYSLYQRDPDAYKAMFGDKGGVADRAQATKMFTFFEKQRDEISKNFMLGDDEKKQKLDEIDELEKPFKEAATAGGGPTTAGGGPTHPGDIHRVRVIAPDGTEGTVPLRQLKAAKQKGYRVAP